MMCLSPFLIIAVVASFDTKLSWVLPFFSISQCYPGVNYYIGYMNYTMRYAIGSNFIHNFIFFGSIFVLRKVDSTFNAIKEFYISAFILYFAFGLNLVSLLFLSQTPFVVMGYYQYIVVFASISLLYLSSI